MGPPTIAHRVDQLEEKGEELEESMADLVGKAVEITVSFMKQALTELLIEGQATTARKQGDELDALAIGLEGRINRIRESQEQMINMIRNDQLNFHSELKSTVTGL